MKPALTSRRALRAVGSLFLALFCSFVFTTSAEAQSEYEVLLNLDNDTATGCTVDTIDGPFAGVEERVVTTVASGMSGLEVVSVEVEVCTGAVFGPPTPVNSPPCTDGVWPVGEGLGTGGSDVIETCYPLGDYDGPVLRLGLIAGNQMSGGDALLTGDGSDTGGPILLPFTGIIEIPTLSEWALILLASLLAFAAFRMMRRQGVPPGAAVGVLLVFLAATAWAAIVLDGLPGDWTEGDRLANDAPAMGSEVPDLRALFARAEGDILFLRIDAAADAAPMAGDDAYDTDEDTTLNVAAPGVLDNDMDPEGGTLTVTAVNGNAAAVGSTITLPSGAMLTMSSDGGFTYEPAADFDGTDSFTYDVSDGTSSSTATVVITVNPENDAPTKSAVVNASGFSEGGGPALVFDSVTVDDVDDVNLESATITLVNRPDGTDEVLAVDTTGTSIMAMYDPMTGVLTLTGTDLVANYEQVIASLTYDNASMDPDTTDREIRCEVSDGELSSPPQSVMFSVGSTNDPPEIMGMVNGMGFTEGDGPTAVYSSLTVTDDDDTNLESGVITLVDRPDGMDEVLAVSTGGTGITASAYNQATGQITLSGTDTVANYQAVIASLTYDNASIDPDETPRTITAVVNDGDADSNTLSVEFTVTAVNTPPMVTNSTISYNAVGNTLLRVDGPDADDHDAGFPERIASTADATDAFAAAGPSDPDSASVTYVAGSYATMQGGTVVIDDDGDFHYMPPTGFEGMDSVVINLTDGDGGMTPVTFELTVAEVVWYVEDTTGAKNPAGGDGRSTDAFETLAAAEAASGPGDYILLFETDSPLDETITLKSGQKLYGQPVEDLNPGLLPGGLLLEEIADTDAKPEIDRSTGDGVRVDANAVSGDLSGVEIRHLSIDAEDNAVDVVATGTQSLDVALSDLEMTAQNGAILNVNGAATTGMVTVTEIDGLVTFLGGAAGGQIFESVLFDADTGTAGVQTVTGGDTQIGSPGNPAGLPGPGLRLNNVLGSLDYGDLDIANTTGTGLFVRDAGGKGGSFQLDTDGGDIQTLNAPAIDLDPVMLGMGGMDAMVLDNVASQVSSAVIVPYGINLDTVAGAFTVSNSTTIVASMDGVITNSVVITDTTAAVNLVGPTVLTNPDNSAILMSNVDGDVSIPSALSSITSAGGPAVDIDQGLGDFLYNGSIMNGTGRSVEVTNHEGPGGGSQVTFGGSITDTGSGIFLTNNDQGAGGSTLNFLGALNLTTGSSNAFTATEGGVVNVTDPSDNNSITTTTGTGVDFVNTIIGPMGVKFTTVNVGDANPAAPNAVEGINLTQVGAGNFEATGGSIRNVTGFGLDVSGGSGNITVGAGISTTSTGRSVEVTTHTGGTVAVSGAIDDNGLGVRLANNVGANLSFTGSMDIDTVGANNGFDATGGGTLTVMTGDNEVDTSAGTGIAVNIQNTTIGAGGVTFRNVSANGAPSGIVLDTTGATGIFEVTGDGATGAGISANNDSGGTILNTTGDGVQLTSVTGVTLDQMRIQDAADHGIDGSGVANLTLTRANLVSNGDANQEHGMNLLNPGGIVTVTNVLGDGNFDAHLRVFSQTGNNLGLFQVNDSVLQNVVTGFFEDAISFETQTGVTTAISVTNSTFANHDGDHIQASSNGSAVMGVTISGNTMTGTASNLGAGITVNSAGNFSGSTTFAISGNNIQKSNDNSSSINVNIGTSLAGGSYSGTVSGNTIGTLGNADSAGDTGISAEVNQNATMTVAITGNTIREFDNFGIDIGSVDGTGTINATITGNTVTSSDSNVFAAVFVDSQTNNVACADIGGAGALENTLSASAGFTDVAFQTGGTGVINLESYGGAASNQPQIQTYIQGRNAGSPGVQLNVGGGAVQGGGGCPTP